MNRYTDSFIFNDNEYFFTNLKKIYQDYSSLKKLPISLKIILEENVRNSNDEELNSLIEIFVQKNRIKNIKFYPNRILMQDYTGIPTMVDFASMRDILKSQGVDERIINPKIMVDLVVDHSLEINSTNQINSLEINLEKEIEKNAPRYKFIKWANKQFENFSVVPAGKGICHQINLEYLSTMITVQKEDEKIFIYPEKILGTDSHTTMINALGVLAWGISGIQAQAVMLNPTLNINLPKVIGLQLCGELKEGVNSSDIIRTLTNFLKEYDTNEKIIEFYGEGLKELSLEDRATIANMAPEYKALCTYFIVDDNTIKYVEKTRGVDASIIKEYFVNQGLFDIKEGLVYDEDIKFDLSLVQAVVSGPKMPNEKVNLRKIPSKLVSFKSGNLLKDNDIVLASINSCMSTSNPTLMIQAALLAKKAISFGLEINTNIKKSFTPGSLVVREYLSKLDLLKYFEFIGFEISGYGCACCFGNSGHLIPGIEDEIQKYDLNVSSVTSGNINYQGKINHFIKSNWLMSPALVLAYSFKGTINCNLTDDEIAKNIYLKDLWPSNDEVQEYLNKIDFNMFSRVYQGVFDGNRHWEELPYFDSLTYNWDEDCTYIKPSQIFEDIHLENIDIKNAKILAILGDKVSTDLISPVDEISSNSSAGVYLSLKGLKNEDFNSYGSRRANKEVMLRGMFSSRKLKNKIISPKEGGFTKDFQNDEIISIYDFSEKMQKENRPLVLFANEDFGIGSLRDWAVKGIKLLGIKAIIAKSFDSKYKSSLISVGVLPLIFINENLDTLNLEGDETISIKNTTIVPNSNVILTIQKEGNTTEIELKSKLETKEEVEIYKNGGILAKILKNIQ